MKLSELIKGLKVESIVGDTKIEICDIKIDSNEVNKGSLFICINGKDFDGHSFIKQVELYGAKAVVCEKKLNTKLTQIIVKDSRIAMSELASIFYGKVDKKMDIIGVVGTNGKTTTAHLIKQVLCSAGKKCGVIGTLGTYYLDEYIEPCLTTPDPLSLHETLFKMYSAGVRTVVMEVSAHAIYLNKLKGISFKCAVFTNFSQDHLDFFGDLENYKNAKLKFFKENVCEYVVVNSDDQVGREITTIVPRSITYGVENPSDVFAIDVKTDREGAEFIINLFDLIYNVKTKLIGKFNVYNTLATATACALLGIKPKKVIDGIEKAQRVSGRLEKIDCKDFSVYIDYAHTPDGLEKALKSLREITKKRLICVFGCGGNRDVGKRPIMGEICAKNADFCIITSDNPRYEEPMEIIYEIEKGVIKQSKKFVSIEEREQAIEYALNMAKSGDVVLIAGKGSEQYQEILGIKKPYNDKDTVEEYIRRNNP